MKTLFPAEANPLLKEHSFEFGKPLTKGSMAGKRHSVRVGCYGNPNGIPVAVIHGGPGGGCADIYTQVFPPGKFYIIMIDQRGAGRSTPSAQDCLCETGELEGNNTDALIEDMEMIRKRLLGEKGRWNLFGGSWGPTLILLYAERYPQHVDVLVLRGVWLGDPEDMDRLFEAPKDNFLKTLRPEAWERFMAPIEKIRQIPELKHHYDKSVGDPMPITRCSFSLLTDPAVPKAIKREVVLAWAGWESWVSSSSNDRGRASCDTVMQLNEHDNPAEVQKFFSMYAIEMYYFLNKCFIEPDAIMANIASLSKVRGVYIIQGANDFLCPEANGALLLKKAFEALSVPVHYHLCDQSGHSFTEPGIVSALIEATTALSAHYQEQDASVAVKLPRDSPLHASRDGQQGAAAQTEACSTSKTL